MECFPFFPPSVAWLLQQQTLNISNTVKVFSCEFHKVLELSLSFFILYGFFIFFIFCFLFPVQCFSKRPLVPFRQLQGLWLLVMFLLYTILPFPTFRPLGFLFSFVILFVKFKSCLLNFFPHCFLLSKLACIFFSLTRYVSQPWALHIFPGLYTVTMLTSLNWLSYQYTAAYA